MLTSKNISWLIASLSCLHSASAAFQPCPLFNAYYPPPSLNPGSAALKPALQKLDSILDGLVKTGHSDAFGDITPNTTSFSLVVFSGAQDSRDGSILFHYEHTAPAFSNSSAVTLDTPFALGTLTQLFTVYTYLIEIGDAEWATPISEFIPELKGSESGVDWDDITIGALSSQMSGLVRSCKFIFIHSSGYCTDDLSAFACELEKQCDLSTFIEKVSKQPPYFLPDTTPIVSNAAFELIAFALEARKTGQSFQAQLQQSVLEPLQMRDSGLLASDRKFYGPAIQNHTGEPAALSMFSTANDLAKAGTAMLSSTLLSKAVTRRWLQPTASTSNLRNAVGRPWEIYHAGEKATSSIVDVYTKTGELERNSAYFGLAPAVDVGFAILAADADRNPDLNAYADVVSLALVQLQALAANETAALFAGTYSTGSSSAVLNVTKTDIQTDPGLAVQSLAVGGVDVLERVAAAAAIEPADLDMRLYPSNAGKGAWVAVYQDRAAPVDAGTPTCVSWQDVGALGPNVPARVVFEVDEVGRTTALRVDGFEEAIARQG